MKLFLAYSICYLFGLFFQIAAVAHGDVHQQILALTQRIEAGENRGELLLQRAELFRCDEDSLAALADCTEAAKIHPTNSLVHFVRGKILLQKKKFAEATAEFGSFLDQHPQHAEALLLRARASSSLDKIAAATEDYTAAIRFAAAPEPDWYYEFAQMLKTAGQGKKALALLEEGSKKSGAVSLELFAIDLAMELKEFDEALQRLDKLCSQSQRKEKWFVRRGEVLEQAGRLDEARESFQQAEDALAALPRSFQSSASGQQVRAVITAAQQRLK